MIWSAAALLLLLVRISVLEKTMLDIYTDVTDYIDNLLVNILEVVKTKHLQELGLSFTFPVFSSQVPLVAVDSFFYGKPVIAPLNILLYNVFTPHGPDLYGKFENVAVYFYYVCILISH